MTRPHARIQCQFFLGPPFFLPKRANDLANVHRRIFLSNVTPWQSPFGESVYMIRLFVTFNALLATLAIARGSQVHTWLCSNVPEPTLTHASKLAFVAGWLSDLLAQPGVDLGRANLQKFLMRNLLEARIRELRRDAVNRAYQETLFGDGNDKRVTVTSQFPYDFRPEAYAPSRDYDGRFGLHAFRKHFYSRIGDFDSKEEFECAVWLDIQTQKGRLQYWVRNLARREGASFFLQKATGRFYPDFVCKLNNDTCLIVEYKGADRWTDGADDRLIGGLWQKLSGGACRFVMVKDKQWDAIEPLLT